MLLSAFLSAFKTEGVKVTIMDADGNKLIQFISEGYASVESDILAKTVRKFELTSASALVVTIENS